MPVAVFCVAAVFTHRSHRSCSAPGMGAQRHLPALILGAGYLGWFIPLLSFPPGDLPFSVCFVAVRARVGQPGI